MQIRETRRQLYFAEGRDRVGDGTYCRGGRRPISFRSCIVAVLYCGVGSIMLSERMCHLRPTVGKRRHVLNVADVEGEMILLWDDCSEEREIRTYA
jgi:hypothetical protein